MPKMRIAQVSRPAAEFELVERDIPEPARGEVRIKVQACGICHSDEFTKNGTWPGLQYPRAPGHEIAGVIAGWPSGTAADSEDTLRFAALSGVRPMIEVFPLARVREAYERMITGKARFRAVLKMAT
jgi:D-arabinose 1-dehydrogenase-like Zn-dependent alcohol dehydrogenase